MATETDPVLPNRIDLLLGIGLSLLMLGTASLLIVSALLIALAVPMHRGDAAQEVLIPAALLAILAGVLVTGSVTLYWYFRTRSLATAWLHIRAQFKSIWLHLLVTVLLVLPTVIALALALDLARMWLRSRR
ncbi:MAG: hypothetical protein ACKVS8_00700 [Phycisphaerales bacterium]